MYQITNLNLIPGSVLPVVNVSQYDKGRQFQLLVSEGEYAYDLTGKTVTIRGTKPDMHGFDYGTADGVLTVAGNVVNVFTTTQMTAVAGQVMAELRIASGSTILGTINFIINVEASALSDETIISDTEIPVIERDFEAALAEAEADALVAEGYAKGTQNGTPVGSGSPYYHDNAKHYKEEAEAAASGVLEKYPKIVADYWYIWDVDTNQYVNTGVRAKGTQGDPGEGVPAGGTTGQVLKKKSDDDYDTEWGAGGGGASALDDLTDVDITSPASGQGLLFDGAKWANGKVVVPDELTDELREAEVIEGKNLMPTLLYDLSIPTLSTGASTFNYKTNGSTFIAKIDRNTDYVISRAAGDRFRVALSTDFPVVDGACYVVINDASLNYGQFNSGNYDYVTFFVNNASKLDADTIQPMLCTLEEWTASQTYVPYYAPVKDGKQEIAHTAGYHNSIYRGKYLGSSVTPAQWSAISSGLFDDLFIGDYWTINGVNYRIAAFDYWLGLGDTECTTHHVVIVTDAKLYNAKMNDTDISTGGYSGSKMYTENLDAAKTTINSAFGSSHILSHREQLSNAVSSGKASAWGWFDSTVELLSEYMLAGSHIWSSGGFDIGTDNGQLPLFALNHCMIMLTIRDYCWLRDVQGNTAFSVVRYAGNIADGSASSRYGVRPVFGIC